MEPRSKLSFLRGEIQERKLQVTTWAEEDADARNLCSPKVEDQVQEADLVTEWEGTKTGTSTETTGIVGVTVVAGTQETAHVIGTVVVETETGRETEEETAAATDQREEAIPVTVMIESEIDK